MDFEFGEGYPFIGMLSLCRDTAAIRVSLHRGTPYKGIRILGIYKYRFRIEVRVHTRQSCTAVHPQEVTLSDPKGFCERMKNGEVSERDGERAGAAR